ncbi:ATP-binding cassette domain-containing protein [Emticicia sediminis]
MKLEADSINLRFGENVVLSDIYTHFTTGNITGVLGRNGCGKSSLFKIIFGTQDAEYATIRVDNIYNKSLYKSNLVKYLPQNFVIPANISVQKAIYLFNSDTEKCNAYFKTFDIDLSAKMEILSGGQRRLVEIIIFIYSESHFIILDEPFTHLMPLQIEKLKELFVSYKDQKCLIISDHQYKHIIDIADNIYLLKDAKTHLLTKGNYIEDLKRLVYIL